MDQKSTYMQRLSNVAWKLLKYIRRLALTGCVLFTAVFWIAWAIALSQGMIYRFQFWKFGIKMTLITLAAVVAVVLWRFFDMRRVGILTAFCTFEATLALLCPMVDLYYAGFNPQMISYQENKAPNGNINIWVYDFPEVARVYNTEPKTIFFWHILNWDTENNRYALGKKYYKNFSAITCEDGITRYFSSGYPEVKARVYDTRNWRKGDIVDDYIQKLERYLILQCYKEERMGWEYVYTNNKSFGEGDLYFVVKEDDDLVQYSKDISKMISKVLEELIFRSAISFEGSITIKYEHKSASDNSVTFKFGGHDLEQPEYYTDWRHVLKVLEDGM